MAAPPNPGWLNQAVRTELAKTFACGTTVVTSIDELREIILQGVGEEAAGRTAVAAKGTIGEKATLAKIIKTLGAHPKSGPAVQTATKRWDAFLKHCDSSEKG